MQAAYATLRDHARERGIPFAITFADFEAFARPCAYVERKGAFAECLTVDRIENLRGYESGNLQPLSRSANAEKQAKRDEIRTRAGFGWKKEVA